MPSSALRAIAIRAKKESAYGIGAIVLGEATVSPVLAGRVRRLRFLVAHDEGFAHVLAEIRADDLHDYACPDYQLDSLTADELAGAFEARAGNYATTDRSRWVRAIASSDTPLRLFPQHLGERERRARLSGTSFLTPA